MSLITEWSKALSLNARCPSSLIVCPDGRVVYGIGTECSVYVVNWRPALIAEWCKALPLNARCLSLVRACPDGRVVLKSLPLNAQCLSSLGACPDSRVVLGIATECSVSIITEGLPWWPSGLKHWHWMFGVCRHWRPALMVEWSKALQLNAQCQALQWKARCLSSPRAEWSKTSPLLAWCPSPLRLCPDSGVV